MRMRMGIEYRCYGIGWDGDGKERDGNGWG